MRFLKRAWSGEERLWKVFWIYAILAGAIIDEVQQRLLVALFSHIRLSPLHIPLWVGIAGGLWGVLALTYGIWISVALWKCSFNTRWRPLGYAARVAFALGLLDFTSGFPGVSEQPGDNELGLSAVMSVLGNNSEAAAKCTKAIAEKAKADNLDIGQYMLQQQDEIQKCLSIVANPEVGNR